MNRVNIFDFDGTIAETNLLKTKAFSHISEEFGCEVRDWFVNYHRENGGVTRQEKIKKLCSYINQPDRYNDLIEKYESYLADEWLDAPLLPGFVQYVESLQGENFILSGGSEVEIVKYVKHHNLDKYFAAIFGNPVSKKVNLGKIASLYINNGTCVSFYGDSKLDFELCQAVGGKFYFISSVSEWDEWHNFKADFSGVMSDFRF